MRIEKVGKKKEAEKKKELDKNMPTGGLMKRMAKMRNKILAEAEIKQTEPETVEIEEEEKSNAEEVEEDPDVE